MENIEGKGKNGYTVVLKQEFANIKWQFEEQGHGKSHIPYLEIVDLGKFWSDLKILWAAFVINIMILK